MLNVLLPGGCTNCRTSPCSCCLKIVLNISCRAMIVSNAPCSAFLSSFPLISKTPGMLCATLASANWHIIHVLRCDDDKGYEDCSFATGIERYADAGALPINDAWSSATRF